MASASPLSRACCAGTLGGHSDGNRRLLTGRAPGWAHGCHARTCNQLGWRQRRLKDRTALTRPLPGTRGPEGHQPSGLGSRNPSVLFRSPVCTGIGETESDRDAGPGVPGSARCPRAEGSRSLGGGGVGAVGSGRPPAGSPPVIYELPLGSPEREASQGLTPAQLRACGGTRRPQLQPPTEEAASKRWGRRACRSGVHTSVLK